MADRQISKEEFERLYGKATAGAWGNWSGEAAKLDWFYSQDPKTYDYALELRAAHDAGLPYAAAVKQAQRNAYGRERDGGVLPMNAENRAWLNRPMSSPLPPQTLDLSGEAVQGELPLRNVTRLAGKYASPTKVSNPLPAEVLAALASGRAVDQPAPTPQAPDGQLLMDWSGQRQQLEQVIEQAAAAPVPKAPSSAAPEGWRRMAGRWGLPALAALGGFSLLAAATGIEQPREQQVMPA
jgi:hypothetical protein